MNQRANPSKRANSAAGDCSQERKKPNRFALTAAASAGVDRSEKMSGTKASNAAGTTHAVRTQAAPSQVAAA